MGQSAQILRNNKTKMSTAERVKEFFEIIHPLGFFARETDDGEIHVKPDEEARRGVWLWVDQEDYPIYTINGADYYREVFFDFVWDDKAHGIESMNSDIVLAIVAEYMKKYPDALFDACEVCSYESKSPFFDKSDIEAIISQPFQPGWTYLFKSHLHQKELGRWDMWSLEE